jgi:hypothetical protein
MASGQTWTCQYPSDRKVGVKVSGTSCVYDEECVANNICIDHTCVGIGKGLYCSSNTDCDVGLFCANNKTCVPQIKVGRTGCMEDAHCVNNAGCQIYSYTDTDVNLCTKYFSLDNYHALLGCSPAGEINYLCESGFCINVGMSVCYPAPAHYDKIVKCSTNNDCISKPTGQLKMQFFSECLCGLNSDREGFCSLFPGDDIYNDYDDMIRTWLNSDDVLKCNTYGRFGKYSMETFKGKDWVDEFTYKEFRAMNLSLVHNAKDCVLETLLPSYKKPEEKEESDSSFSEILLGTFILITI